MDGPHNKTDREKGVLADPGSAEHASREKEAERTKLET